MSGYTVIDVETTGLHPEGHDRIVELGVVYVSHEGEIQDHWSTLVNPGRDVGATRIHGITAADVLPAPSFADLAPYVLRAIAGRTIVAHNASFDLRFLANELQRAGVLLEELPLVGVCTMRWSESFLHAASRRLIDCCKACGVSLQEAHSAAGDAMATAQLLAFYLQQARLQPPWGSSLDAARAYPWPSFHGDYPELRMLHRAEVRAARQDQWLDSIIARMPRSASPRVDEYLAVLEMALLDGFLAEHEKDALVETARLSGLTRGQVLDLHGLYLQAMAEVAWADGVVTADERADILRTALMLGLRETDVDQVLAAAAAGPVLGPEMASSTAERLANVGIELLPGDRVVFTGDMAVERDVWFARARAAGLEPGGVTKKTKVVVAADPNSLSSKAAKARAYGIPIVTDAAFERLLAASTVG